jgi:hypothetical protein
MSNEPHAPWREGLDKAGSAPRCGARRRDGERLPGSCDAERALPHARRQVHRAENGRGAGAVAHGTLAARALIGRGPGASGAKRGQRSGSCASCWIRCRPALVPILAVRPKPPQAQATGPFVEPAARKGRPGSRNRSGQVKALLPGVFTGLDRHTAARRASIARSSPA